MLCMKLDGPKGKSKINTGLVRRISRDKSEKGNEKNNSFGGMGNTKQNNQSPLNYSNDHDKSKNLPQLQKSYQTSEGISNSHSFQLDDAQPRGNRRTPIAENN